MSFDDPPPLFLVDVERPLAPLGSSAEDEPVGARHHMDGEIGRGMDAAECPVVDVGLGRDGRELSFERGVFFYEQTADALSQAILLFEKRRSEFRPQAIRDHVQAFDRGHFKERINQVIMTNYEQFCKPRSC